MTGYHLEASDGEIGHVEDFLIDQGTWKIRYLEVKTRNWLPVKRVLISPEWVEGVSWAESRVSLGLSRETIKSAPEYIESRPITAEDENQLHQHYGKRPYWLDELKYNIRRFDKGVRCLFLGSTPEVSAWLAAQDVTTFDQTNVQAIQNMERLANEKGWSVQPASQTGPRLHCLEDSRKLV